MGATYFRKMWPVSVLGLLALLCWTHAWPNTHNDVQCEEAPRCDQAACEALGTENCHCSGNETSIKIDDRPQIVYLTFDDAFSALVYLKSNSTESYSMELSKTLMVVQ